MSLATNNEEPNGLPIEPVDQTAATPALKANPLTWRWLRWFVSEANHQPTFLGHVVLAGSLITAILLSYWVMFWFAGTKQNEWLGSHQRLETKQIEAAIADLPATPVQKVRLIDQFEQIQTRIDKHGTIMSFFYRQYFISLSMICGASVVASVCLFFISKVGWERVNNALINIFIISSGTIIFYGNISIVFKQEANIEDNQRLYLSYFSLRNEMLSYWATQQIVSGDTAEPVKFIHYMDQRLQELNQIRLGFDATRTTQLREQFQQLTLPENNSSQPNPQNNN